MPDDFCKRCNRRLNRKRRKVGVHRGPLGEDLYCEKCAGIVRNGW